MSRVVLGLGANLGDRLAQLQSVLDGLGSRVVAVSTVYETPPWGDEGQPDYLNAVLVAQDSAFGPWDWLRLGQQLEHAAGRVRDPANQYAARPLDVDVLACDELRSSDPQLTLPHPRAHLRAFVLVPWIDVEPDAMLVTGGAPRPLRELLAGLGGERAQVRATDLRLLPGGRA